MKKIFGILIFLLVVISLSVASGETLIAARRWQLVQVEFDEDINPATDILIKENMKKPEYHIDKPDMAFNTNVMLPIPETEEEINEGAIIEWQVIDSSTGFRTGDEAIKATFTYFDASERWMPELDGLNPMDAKKYGAIFYAHRKWNYEAAKIVTVSDRIQFLGGGKFRVGFIEESENCYDEEGNLEVITFRTYGLIPGADFSKSQGGNSRPSGGGGTKPSGGGSTGLITPTPGGDDPNPPTPTPPPAETNEPHPEEDPIETLAPRNTPSPTPPPAQNEPAPEEDVIILAPRSDGKESSAPTAASSSTNVEASSSSSSSETTNTSSTTTTTTETSSTSDTSSTSSADTSNNGTPDDSSAAGQPNAVEDEIVLVPRGGG